MQKLFFTRGTVGVSSWMLWLMAGLLLHLPALRPIFRFAPQPELAAAAYLLAVAAGLYLAWRHRVWLEQKLDNAWPFALGLVAVAVLTALLYPIADGLSAQGRGSDGDDAMIVGLQSWLAFGNPYHLRTYFGNPLSPGPGWIALAAPFSATHTYALIVVAALALCAWAARGAGVAWGRINLAFGLLFSSLATWEMTVTGIDHLPIALLFLAIALRALKSSNPWEWLVLGLLVGSLASARVVFFYWPLLLGFALLPLRGWRVACMVGGVGFAAVLLWHGWGFATSPDGYHPWHVVQKTDNYGADGGQLFLILTLAACALTGLLMLLNWWRWPPLLHLWLGVGVPLACTGLGDLAVSGNLGNANLASYLLLGAPLMLAWWLWDVRIGGKPTKQL